MRNTSKFSLNPSLKRREDDKFGKNFQDFSGKFFYLPFIGRSGAGF
jgi:hypothetical protein